GTALGEKGQTFSVRCDGILARVIQHEMDHLNGIEFIQKVEDYSKIIVGEYYRKKIKSSKEQLKLSKITVLKYLKVS
ncbi:peptide deformylase, partial [Candidatus Microgenomates bacterium]|nr:peptide deformylase [Candidatus Microgenomates bacterium]